MTKTWKSVRDSEAYKSLSSEERDAARRQYFLDVVAPKVNTDELPDAFKQFDAETAPTFKNKVKELAGDAVDTIGESMGFGGKSPGLADTQTVPGVIDATTQPTPMTWEGINAKTRAEQAARDQARIILLEQERADPSKTPAQLADLERELADTRAKIGVASPATEAPQVDVASTMLKPDAGAFDQLVGEKEKPDWELFDQRGFMPAQADLKKRIDAKQRLDELKAIRARTGANQITAENILTGAQKASDIAAQKVIQAGGDVDAANQAGAQAAADALNPGAVSNMPENIQFQQDNPLASAALSGTAKFVGGAYGAADAVHKAIDPANHIGAVVDYFTGLGEPDFGKVADKLNAMGEDFTTAMQKRDFSVALSQGQGLEWMLTSALGNAPSLASSAIGMFNPAAAGVMLGTMAASAGGGQYRELINQGYDQSIAMLSGIAHATLEYALERVPIEVGQRLLTEFKALSADARANLGRRIVGAMSVGAGMAGTEGLEELGTQIGQNTADIATGYAQAAVGVETPSTKRMKEKSVLDGAMNAFMGGVAGGATHGGAIAASVMMPDGTQQQVDPSAAAAEMARQSALNAWAGDPLTRGAASRPPPTGPLTQSLAAAPIAPAVPPVGAAPTVPPMGTDDGTGLADESVPVDAINAEELLGTPKEERTPESFAAEIADGKTLDTPEDIQYYQNNKDAVEAELNRLAAIGWDEQSTDQATPEGEGLAAQPDQVAAQQGAQQVSATDQAAQEVATAQDTSTPRIALNIQEIKRKNGAIGTQGVSELQVRDVLTHVAGMSIPENATMREMVKAFKDSPEAQQRMRDFTAANPLKGVMLPDGTIHIQDGHHRAFLLDQAGDSTIPSIIKDYAVPSTSGATDGRGNPLQEVPEVVAPSSAVPGADLPGSGDIAVGAGDGTGMVGSSAPDMPVSGSGTDVPVRDAEPGREAVEESVFDKRYPDAKSAENVIKFRKLKDVQVFKDGDGFRIGAKVSNKPAPSDNLIQRIKQLGGINTRYRSDVIGDKAGAPGLFSNTGKGLDDLATELKADGFDIDTDEAGGGVDALTRLIQRAVMGESILSLAGQEKAVQKQLEQEYRSGLKEAIDQEGGTYRKNATTKQLEAMLEELRAKEAMMERESIQGDINLAEDQSDELVSRNVTEAEFMAAMGFTEEEANEINAISEKPVEDVTEGTPEESDGARADQGQDQETGEGSKQEEGLSSDQADAKQEPADAKQQTGTPELELIGQTPEEVAAEERARAEQAKRAKAELDRIEAEAKQKRIDAEIAARQEASAENFVLGQSAEDALAGQGDIFSQAEKPATNRYTPPKSDKEARSRWVGELGNGDPVRGPGHEAMLDAVGKALDAGLFYTKEFNKFVADVLGVTDQSAFAVDRTEGGPFGYEVYYARKVVEKERADNRNKDIGEKLRLSVGENIGRLRLNDGKIASASTIASVGDTSAVIMAKRGPQTIKVTLTFDSLMAYAERADNDYLARKVAIYAEVAARQEASAENFVLGQSAEDALAGQGDIFSQAVKPTEKPAAQEKPVSFLTFKQWVEQVWGLSRYKDSYLENNDGNERLAKLSAATGGAADAKVARAKYFAELMALPRDTAISLDVFDALNDAEQRDAQRHFFDLDWRLTDRLVAEGKARVEKVKEQSKPYEDALASVNSEIKRLDEAPKPDTKKVYELRQRADRLAEALRQINNGKEPDGRLLKPATETEQQPANSEETPDGFTALAGGDEWVKTIKDGVRKHQFNIRRYGDDREYFIVKYSIMFGGGFTGAPSTHVGTFNSLGEAVEAVSESMQRIGIAEATTTEHDNAQTPTQAEAPQDQPSQPQELPAEVLETPVNATSSVQAEAASGVPVEKQARTLTEDGRASDGKPINPGDTFRTLSGRTTTPYPKQKSEKYASQWLIDNAIEEAKSRGDGFNETAFGGEKVMKGGGIPPASRDSMLMYLFGQQPVVVPSILKPLTASNRNAKPGLTIDDIPPMFLQKLMVKLPVLNTKTNQYQNGEANALEALTETRSDIDKMKALLNCLTA